MFLQDPLIKRYWQRAKQWKEKVKEKSKMIWCLKKRLIEALKSRDKWKQKAEDYKKLYEESKKKHQKEMKE